MRVTWFSVGCAVGALACGETFDTGTSGSGGAASASRSASGPGATNASTTSTAQGGASCGPGSVAEFTDGFEQGPFDAGWELWNNRGTSVTQDNELVVHIDVGTMPRYAGVSSASTYSLVSCAVTIKVPHVPTSAGAIAFLQVSVGDTDYLWTYFSAGVPARLAFGYRKDGMDAEEVAAMFNASEQRYWRIAEKNGEISWQTSPDGMDWVTHRMEVSPFAVDEVRITLGAGSDSITAMATDARFDDLNL